MIYSGIFFCGKCQYCTGNSNNRTTIIRRKNSNKCNNKRENLWVPIV